MKITSIRFKTTLLYSGVLLIVLAAYTAIIVYMMHTIMLNDLDERLNIKAEEILTILEAYETVHQIAANPHALLEELLTTHTVIPSRKYVIDELWRSQFKTLQLHRDYISIRDAQATILFQSKNMTPDLDKLLTATIRNPKKEARFCTIKDQNIKLRVINFTHFYKSRLPLIVQVATPIKRIDAVLDKLIIFSSISVIGILIITIFLGSFFARRVLRPVEAVTNAARSLSFKDLSVRITSHEADKEMVHLIEAFNSMIDRLERSFNHINEFNSHVAHELKTPITIVKNELEFIIETLDDSDETKKALSVCIEETDRMTKIIKDLLLVAQLDYKPQILRYENLPVKTFCEEIFEHSQMLASEKNITVTLSASSEPMMIRGDKVHLRRLFLNLVSNAIHYTPAGGTISIITARYNTYAQITVSDTGEGIAADDIPKIFNKFYRCDKHSHIPSSGNGLGLSIVQSIARAHQGFVTVRSVLAQGTTFDVFLPLVY